MKNVVKFIESKEIDKLDIYSQLKCNIEEVKILQYLTKQYILAVDSLLVIDILSEFYDLKIYEHLKKIYILKNLLELGWIVQSNFSPTKISDAL